MRDVWLGTAALVLWIGTATMAIGQNAPALPDAPLPASQVPEPVAGDAIYAPLATGTTPESQKIKFEEYLVIAFGPRAIVSPAFSAAIRMANPPKYYPRNWKDGAEAFGRNYGNALGGKVASSTARYAAGALLHEDFRYRPATSTGVSRLFHAIGYTFVDESDTGHSRIAIANFAGAAAGGFIPNLWLPDGYNEPGDGAKRFATHIGSYAFQNVTREYAPEIARTFRALHLPFPRLPVREWYTDNLAVAQGGRSRGSLRRKPAVAPAPAATTQTPAP